MPFLNPQSSIAVPVPSPNPFPGIAAPFTFTWGESTGQGLLSNPAITVQYSVPAGFMAIGGVRPLDGGADLAVDFASFTQMFAQTVAGTTPEGPIGNCGETMDAGALIAYGQACKALAGFDLATSGQRWITTNGAIGGRSQVQINTGADWTQTEDILDAYVDRSVADAFTTELVAIQEAIGQNDMNDGTTGPTFTQAMIDGRQQIVDYWNNATGRTDNPPLYYLTVGSFNDTGNVLTIPEAMIQLPFDDENFINCGPTYQITYSDGVGVHYANTGEKTYGYIVGWARFLHDVRGQKWSCPTIDTLTRDGSSVRLSFKGVYAAPLKFDTSWVTDPGDYGFLLMHGDQAKATSCFITAGVLTVGGTVTGTFAVGQTIWAAKYTQLNNVPAGTTITADLGGGTWQLSNNFTMPGPAPGANFTVIAQTVVDIDTPTISGDLEVTLTTADDSPIPAGWVVSYATRGIRAAGPTTGSRGNLCDSTAFAITNQTPTYTIRGFAQIFERTLS